MIKDYAVKINGATVPNVREVAVKIEPSIVLKNA